MENKQANKTAQKKSQSVKKRYMLGPAVSNPPDIGYTTLTFKYVGHSEGT